MQLRADFSSTSALAKTIVTVTAPPAAAASVSALHLGSGRPNSVSTLTLASVPPSLLLEASAGLKGGSVSAATTPLAPAAKHTSFALTPSGMGPSSTAAGSGHHVSFMPMPLPMMGVRRFRGSNSSLGSPTVDKDVASSSAPSLIEDVETPIAAAIPNPPPAPPKAHHAALELRQSVQSQITTLEDVDSDSDSESVGLALVETRPQLEYQAGMASSSSSASVK